MSDHTGWIYRVVDGTPRTPMGFIGEYATRADAQKARQKAARFGGFIRRVSASRKAQQASDHWWAFHRTLNGESTYGWGTQAEADAYLGYLNTDPDSTNVYTADRVDSAMQAMLNDNPTAGFNLHDEFYERKSHV